MALLQNGYRNGWDLEDRYLTFQGKAPKRRTNIGSRLKNSQTPLLINRLKVLYFIPRKSPLLRCIFVSISISRHREPS